MISNITDDDHYRITRERMAAFMEMSDARSPRIAAFVEMCNAMIEAYKVSLLTARPEKVAAIQSYAKQISVLRDAVIDPRGATPIIT